jgi:tetratricopeptide (TPR) repeat protein
MPMERAAMLAGFGVALHALVDNVWTAPVAAAALATLALASSRLTAVRSLPYPLSGRGPAVAGVALALFFYSSSLAPGLAYHLNGSAQAHHARGRIEEAVSVQRLAVALRPNDALMLSNLGVYYKDLYVTNGDLKTLDAAGAYFLRAIEANPAFLAPRQERANQTLARLSGDPARDRPVQRELIETYEGMLELDPYLPFALRNLAEAHYWTGRADLAAQDLARAIEVEPNYVGAHLRLADWSEAAGDAGLAGRLRAEAQSIVERYPDAGNLNEYESLLLGARGPR